MQDLRDKESELKQGNNNNIVTLALLAPVIPVLTTYIHISVFSVQ